MINRKTIKSKDGFSLVEVCEMDENGNVISVSYEVYGPDGTLLDSFPSLSKAESYFQSMLPEPPRPSRGMSM